MNTEDNSYIITVTDHQWVQILNHKSRPVRPFRGYVVGEGGCNSPQHVLNMTIGIANENMNGRRTTSGNFH
jgi:hypothetical protein